jgi:Protein of unknown function (DUF4031)
MIYVDETKQWPSGQWCHMMSGPEDTDLSELHAMATRLGIRRYFQNKPRFPHYDLRPSKRILSVEYGATPITSREMVALCTRKT